MNQFESLCFQESLNLIRKSSTSLAIPKEHKFKISSIASQTLGVFSQTPVPSADPTQPLTEK